MSNLIHLVFFIRELSLLFNQLGLEEKDNDRGFDFSGCAAVTCTI